MCLSHKIKWYSQQRENIFVRWDTERGFDFLQIRITWILWYLHNDILSEASNTDEWMNEWMATGKKGKWTHEPRGRNRFEYLWILPSGFVDEREVSFWDLNRVSQFVCWKNTKAYVIVVVDVIVDSNGGQMTIWLTIEKRPSNDEEIERERDGDNDGSNRGVNESNNCLSSCVSWWTQFAMSSNNQQQPTTTNNNQQQPTTTNNNQQQPTTTNNNQQQPTTTNNMRFLMAVYGILDTLHRCTNVA